MNSELHMRTGQSSSSYSDLEKDVSSSADNTSESVSIPMIPPPPPPSDSLIFSSGKDAGSRSGSINYYHLGVASSSMATPRTDFDNQTGMYSSPISHEVRAEAMLHTPYETENVVGGMDDLHRAVMNASIETTKAMKANNEDFDVRRITIKNCQKLNEAQLKRLLAFDPSLPMSRSTNLAPLAEDGQTPMHIAAKFGNIPALKMFIELGKGVSTWVRDLQGRTALHVAADKGQTETALFLREVMRKEKGIDPVGSDAPTDLSGTTPLGWASVSAKGKPKSGIDVALFKPGDRTILPFSPVSIRAGKSPWKGSSTGGYVQHENLVFAFSEAHGWTPNMEDRTVAVCPVAGRPAWSFFGVCDGHGGAYCSTYLAERLPLLLSREVDFLNRSSSISSTQVSADTDVTPSMLEELLTKICADADRMLSEEPRMAVEISETKRISCLDSSGSTAVLALVTSKFVAVANVGDSRAILACRDSASGEGLSSLGQTPTGPPKVPMLSLSVLKPVELSRDHKGSIAEERERIEAAGATVQLVAMSNPANPVYEVFTTRAERMKLRMTRSFGDFYLKQNEALLPEQQAITAVPEIKVYSRTARDAFLVLACDGIWDVMSNEDVVKFFGEKLGFTGFGGPVGGITTQNAADACDALLQECLRRGTVDNISVILVILGPPPMLVQQASMTSSRSARKDQLNLAHAFDAMSLTPMPPAAGGGASAIKNSPRLDYSVEMPIPHHSSSHPKPSPRLDYDIDMPINRQPPHSLGVSKPPVHLQQPSPMQATSLTHVFEEASDDSNSPLNVMPTSKVRKQLQFNDS